MKIERCHFCNAPYPCYERREDGTNRTGKYYPACENCAKKPYPERVKIATASI